jgi:hypothetical protein
MMGGGGGAVLWKPNRMAPTGEWGKRGEKSALMARAENSEVARCAMRRARAGSTPGLVVMRGLSVVKQPPV